MLNPDTRVAVCCYQGDQRQVELMLDCNLHHGCPVVILSPEDSPVEILRPGVVNRSAGPNEYTGYKSLARFREHLEILLTFPENFFLINDCDSFCLTPKLPDYLYAEPDLLWTNLKVNDAAVQHPFFPPGFPRIAFQPPWFFSRNTIKALLSVTDAVTPNPDMLFIDYWLVQLALQGGIQWKGFPEAISWPMRDASERGHFSRSAWECVRYHGTTFVHAIKTREVCDYLLNARKLYETTPAQAPSPPPPPGGSPIVWPHETTPFTDADAKASWEARPEVRRQQQQRQRRSFARSLGVRA